MAFGEELDYRSPFTMGEITTPETAPVGDEQNLGTLRTVAKELNESFTGLSSDFNAFHILENASDEAAQQSLMRQIAGRQVAYDILEPIVAMVNSALAAVDTNYKGGQ